MCRSIGPLHDPLVERPNLFNPVTIPPGRGNCRRAFERGGDLIPRPAEWCVGSDGHVHAPDWHSKSGAPKYHTLNEYPPKF